MGFLTSRWEDAEYLLQENRPGRRLYTLTALGSHAAAHARATNFERASGAPPTVGAGLTTP